MKLKEFLKPNRKKIVLTILIFMISIISLLFQIFPLFILLNAPTAMIIFIVTMTTTGEFFPFTSAHEITLFGLFVIVSNILYWYFLSCLMVWIHDKWRERSTVYKEIAKSGKSVEVKSHEYVEELEKRYK